MQREAPRHMAFDRDEYDYGSVWRSSMTNEEFAASARRPDEWINAARPLRVSAYVLKAQTLRWDIARIKGESETSRVSLLFTSLFLASLSLENVLKAVLLVRRPELAADGRLRFRTGNENWGHDLVRIASEATFQLEQEELDFLRVSCNPCIVTFGRYPMAVSKANAPSMWQFSTGAFRYFESIFVRAAETALREGRNGATAHRAAELERLAAEIGNDVPQSIMSG
jgi:hypothetical protein